MNIGIARGNMITASSLNKSTRNNTPLNSVSNPIMNTVINNPSAMTVIFYLKKNVINTSILNNSNIINPGTMNVIFFNNRI